MKERDVAYFVSWCIEEYKKVLNISGEQTMDLFAHFGILRYLAENFDVLHTQSRQWIMEEISEVLERRRKEEKA